MSGNIGQRENPRTVVADRFRYQMCFAKRTPSACKVAHCGLNMNQADQATEPVPARPRFPAWPPPPRPSSLLRPRAPLNNNRRIQDLRPCAPSAKTGNFNCRRRKKQLTLTICRSRHPVVHREAGPASVPWRRLRTASLPGTESVSPRHPWTPIRDRFALA